MQFEVGTTASTHLLVAAHNLSERTLPRHSTSGLEALCRVIAKMRGILSSLLILMTLMTTPILESGWTGLLHFQTSTPPLPR